MEKKKKDLVSNETANNNKAENKTDENEKKVTLLLCLLSKVQLISSYHLPIFQRGINKFQSVYLLLNQKGQEKVKESPRNTILRHRVHKLSLK